MSSKDLVKLEKKIKELKMLKKKGGAEEIEATIEAIPDTVSSGVDVREDLSDRVKDLINKIADEGSERFGVFVGNAGGKRKIFECPSCGKHMTVAGARVVRKKDPSKKMTPNQDDWMTYVSEVRKIIPKGGNAMKSASKLRGEGVTLEQLKELKKV